MEQRQSSRGGFRWLAVGCGALVLLALAGGYFGARHVFRAALAQSAAFARAAVESMIAAEELSPQAAEEARAQAERLIRPMQDGAMTLGQARRLIATLARGPLPYHGLFLAIRKQSMETSTLDPAQRSALKWEMDRVTRGLAEATIAGEEVRSALEQLGIRFDPSSQKAASAVRKLNDKELLQLTQSLRALADDKAVPNEPYAFDLTQGLKKLAYAVLEPS